MNKSVSRKGFLKTATLASLTIVPGMNILGKLIAPAAASIPADHDKAINKAYRLINPSNLMYLEFYFLNVNEDTTDQGIKVLRKKENGSPSFVIIRLSQQHIAEQCFEPKNLSINDHSIYASTAISGYSYLVFTLNLTADFPVSVKQFMDWNNEITPDQFKLAVYKEDKQSKNYPSFFEYAIDNDHVNQWKNALNQYPLGYSFDDTGTVFKADRERYPKDKEGEPVTALEIPYRLILSPKNLQDSKKFNFYWEFSLNEGKQEEKDKNIYTYELWYVTLKITKLDRQDWKDREFSPIELGMIGSPDVALKVPPQYADRFSNIMQLPDGKAREELVDLYIRYHLAARTESISFTPLGATTDINFINPDSATNKHSLYLLIQKIAFGRDEEVVLARIIMHATHGHKMLYVETTRRETWRGASILVFRAYIGPLVPEIDNTDPEIAKGAENYQEVNYQHNTPFKKIAFADLKLREVVRLTNMGATYSHLLITDKSLPRGKQELAFWPVTPDGKILEFPMVFTDWHDNVIKASQKLFALHSNLVLSGSYDFSQIQNNVKDGVAGGLQQMANAIEKIKYDFTPNFKNNLPKKIATDANALVKIMELSEDLELKKLDAYRNRLSNLFVLLTDATEKEFTDLAGKAELDAISKELMDTIAKGQKDFKNIKDEIIEESNAFKRRVLNCEDTVLTRLEILQLKIEDSAAQLKQLLGTDYDKFTGGLEQLKTDIEDDVKRNAQKAADKWLKDKSNLEKRFNAVIKPLNDAYKDFNQQYGNYADKVNEFKAAVNNVLAIDVTRLGVEYEFQIFIKKLPPVYLNAVKAQLEEVKEQIKACQHNISIIENSLKCKVDFAKAKVGFAIAAVDDEVKHLKDIAQGDYDKVRDLYHKKINEPLSELATKSIVFRNNIKSTIDKKAINFFDKYACYGQLHTAEVYSKSINDLVHKEIAFKMHLAEDYYKNVIATGKGEAQRFVLDAQNNCTKVFAQVKNDSRELIKGAVREMGKELGGMVNPDMAADYLTYLKDTREISQSIADGAHAQVVKAIKDAEEKAKTLIQDGLNDPLVKNLNEYWKQGNAKVGKAVTMIGAGVNEAIKAKNELADLQNIDPKVFFKALEAKIIGSIHLKDILGEGFKIPNLERRDNKLAYNFVTAPGEIISFAAPGGIFSFTAKKESIDSTLTIYCEKPINKSSDYLSFTRLKDFTVGVFHDGLQVRFDELSIYSDNRTKNKTSVKIAGVDFKNELAFLQLLTKFKIPGTGIGIEITPKMINVDYTFTIPSITGGFTFKNIKFHIGVGIPIPIGGVVSPLVTRLGVNSPIDKFALGVGIWGGKGHCVMEATTKYIRLLDIGMDYGGLVTLSLGIAEGEAFLMAGIRFVYSRTELGYSSMKLYSIITAGGVVVVFGFITISVVFLLYLEYVKGSETSTLIGHASVTYSVSIGFFKKSFTLTFTKVLKGSDSAQGGEAYNALPGQRRDLMDDQQGYLPYEYKTLPLKEPLGKKGFSHEEFAQYKAERRRAAFLRSTILDESYT